MSVAIKVCPATAAAILEEVARPQSRGLVLTKRYVDAREGAIPLVLSLLRRADIQVSSFSSTYMEIRLLNGATVRFVWESADTVVPPGLTLDWAWAIDATGYRDAIDRALSRADGRFYEGVA